MLEKLFQLKAHNTTLRTEILAGITTFLTMAYILFVNPSILAETGMDHGAVFVATCRRQPSARRSWVWSPTTRSRWHRAWA